MKRISTGWMVSILVGSLVLAGLVSVKAQDKAPVVPAEVQKLAPAVPDAVKVKLLQAKLAQERAARQFTELQNQLAALKAAYEKAGRDQAAAETEVYATLKVDRKDWTLDETGDDVKLVATPKPVEAKKP
jgi:hypothetical protein